MTSDFPASPLPPTPTSRATRWLSRFALLGLAHWFFGNFYEAIVLAPNLLTATLPKLLAWQNYFTVTNQIYYYVPLTQLAVAAVWVDWFRSPPATLRRRLLRTASILGLLALLLTAYIITQLNLTLFFGDVSAVRAQLPAMALQWNICNAVRVLIVGGTLYHTHRAHLLAEQEPG